MTIPIRNAIAELGAAYAFLNIGISDIQLGANQAPSYEAQTDQAVSESQAAQSDIIALVEILQAL